MLKTVKDAFELLELMSKQPKKWTLNDLHKEIGLPKANVFRILRSFKELGYIIQDEKDSTYSLSDKMYRVGRNAKILTRLMIEGNDNLRQISRLARASASLCCLDGTDQIILDCVVFDDGVDLSKEKYKNRSAYLSASGLAILAASPEDKVRSFKQVEFQAPMPNSLRNYDELCSEILAIRKRKYAVNNENRKKGIYALAVPVIGEENKVAASFSVTLYTAELSAARLQNVLEILRKESYKLSLKLGYNPTKSINQFWYN